MERFWLQGVVKNGQVVLEKPLDLPDGTLVAITEYDPDDDPRPSEPKYIMTDEEFAEFTAYFTRQKDNKDFPEFVARIERAQAERTATHRSAS